MLHHSNLDVDNTILIQGEFSIPYVLLSILFAIVGTYTAFKMHDRIRDNSFFPRSVWFFMSSFALGFGIWAMHYMGMFAFEMPIKASFHPVYTVISIIPILVAAYFSFYLSYKKKTSLKLAILSSVILAFGVVLMHFIGMYSLIDDAYHYYHDSLLLFTFFIAFFSNFLFYSIRLYLHRPFIKVTFSIFMGAMLSLTHYSAMIGMKIYVDQDTVILDKAIPVALRNLSAGILTAVFIVILLFLLISIFADRYVQYRAEHFDVLTKLPNIRMFEQALEGNVEQNIAIIQIEDLHKCFEETNYLFRETVIQEIALRIEQNMSAQSALYRTDYYQFVVISKINDVHFEKYLKNIKGALNNSSKCSSQHFLIPPFQILFAQRDNNTSLEILYERLKNLIKETSLSNELINLEKKLNQKSDEEEILDHFPNALYNNELFLVYQPKFSPNNSTFNSIEALIRWDSPELGFISPGLFIPVLEKNESIYDLTDWIIFNVCRQLNEWKNKEIIIDSVSINIPGTYVTNKRLKKTLIDAVTRYEIDPKQIELEITETSYVGNIEEASEAVNHYRYLGFQVAIDDFGTGLSSLSYLKKLPINTLKIDKSFVDGVPYSPKDSEILKGIISIASSLKLNIVIEGVEHEEQKEYIHKHFDNVLIQGYYYSKPLIALEFELLYKQTIRQ